LVLNGGLLTKQQVLRKTQRLRCLGCAFEPAAREIPRASAFASELC
jgi:hypothetical protein